ncbi:MAG: hypothetical protein ACKOSR_10410 [Flavobacteriales bacterium]
MSLYKNIFATVLLLNTIAFQAQTTWPLDSTVLVQTDVVTGITRPWEILWVRRLHMGQLPQW